jgi:hypothetical protein
MTSFILQMTLAASYICTLFSCVQNPEKSIYQISLFKGYDVLQETLW